RELAVTGPARITREFALDEYPVFLRAGALVPLNVSRDYTGLGDRASAGFRTWLVNPDADGRFTLWHPETHPDPQATTVTMRAGDTLRIAFAGRAERHLLRVITARAPRRVICDGRELAEGAGWNFDAARGALVIRSPDAKSAKYEISWR
ncbi:MAG: hypothetical protein ACKOE8_03685, partial [Opitutaceae bacterium]